MKCLARYKARDTREDVIKVSESSDSTLLFRTMSVGIVIELYEALAPGQAFLGRHGYYNSRLCFWWRLFTCEHPSRRELLNNKS